MWHKIEKQRGRLLGVGYAVREAEGVATDTEGAGGWSHTRTHSTEAKAYIHRVWMGQYANTSRRGRSSG